MCMAIQIIQYFLVYYIGVWHFSQYDLLRKRFFSAIIGYAIEEQRSLVARERGPRKGEAFLGQGKGPRAVGSTGPRKK